ncbi:MAG: hypothetical protein CL920_35200 [Deltaproteobacteria bacterium]|nr:hypothetical protein [Deltaproteobacteria bacterium]MBU53971.1 hypothetical protein [Deltaproteobacteria bacterium]
MSDMPVDERSRYKDALVLALECLGQGFLQHPTNTHLVEDLEYKRVSVSAYSHQVLRVLMRLLFAWIAEERDELLLPETDEATLQQFEQRFSLHRALRKIRSVSADHENQRWCAQMEWAAILSGEQHTTSWPILGSPLWRPHEWTPLLADCTITDGVFYAVVRALSGGGLDISETFSLDWSELPIEVLSSLLVELSDYEPCLALDVGSYFLVQPRKATRYFQPDPLQLDVFLDRTLEPAITEAEESDEPDSALLALRVCDPYCRDGFLLRQAAQRLTLSLASIRSEDEFEIAHDVWVQAYRDVVGHCLFGVCDDAILLDICKLCFWLEALLPGRPLLFLEHHLQSGNALLHTSPHLMDIGIPDAALQPLRGDEKKVAHSLKKRNRKEADEQGSQLSLFGLLSDEPSFFPTFLHEGLASIESIGQDSWEDLCVKESMYRKHCDAPYTRQARLYADMWCAAFAFPKQPSRQRYAITQGLWTRAKQDVHHIPEATKEIISALASEHLFFQWHIQFAQCFPLGESAQRAPGWSGGFDVLLCLPPWERITQKGGDVFAHFLRRTGLYPAAQEHPMWSYMLYLDLVRSLLKDTGRAGLFTPPSVLFDPQHLTHWRKLSEARLLHAFFAWSEPSLKGRKQTQDTLNCAMLVLGGTSMQAEGIEYLLCDGALDAGMIDTQTARMSYGELESLRPVFSMFPTCRTVQELNLLKSIYQSTPMFEKKGGNAWKARWSDEERVQGAFLIGFASSTAEWPICKVLAEGEQAPLSLYLSCPDQERCLLLLALMSSRLYLFLLRCLCVDDTVGLSQLKRVAFPTPCYFSEETKQKLLETITEMVHVEGSMLSSTQSIGYKGEPFSFDEERQVRLRCQLDAMCFHLYGIKEEDVLFVLENDYIQCSQEEMDWILQEFEALEEIQE